MPCRVKHFVRTKFGGIGHLTQTRQEKEVKSTESKFQEILQVKTSVITTRVIHSYRATKNCSIFNL